MTSPLPVTGAGTAPSAAPGATRGGAPNGPDGPTFGPSIGMVVPYDFALDREIWRWVPEDVALHLTRTHWTPLPVSLEMARVVGEAAEVGLLAHDLVTTTPGCIAYACTSGSFVRGLAGEQELVQSMLAAGFPRAVTTSGALVAALSTLGLARVAIATPYDAAVTAALAGFLQEAGVEVTGSEHLGLTGEIWKVPYAATADLVRRTYDEAAQAVFISCTNVPTYDLIPVLEAELGVPVLTANQVTMWAALRALGRAALGPSRLVDAA